VIVSPPLIGQGVAGEPRKEQVMAVNPSAPERRLLTELGVLSDKLRALRASPRPDANDIRPLEAQMSLKWQQLRLLRAGPLNAEAHPAPRRGGRD
jgi:hypothetical protein